MTTPLMELPRVRKNTPKTDNAATSTNARRWNHVVRPSHWITQVCYRNYCFSLPGESPPV